MFVKVKVNDGKIVSIPFGVYENEYKPYGIELYEDTKTKTNATNKPEIDTAKAKQTNKEEIHLKPTKPVKTEIKG